MNTYTFKKQIGNKGFYAGVDFEVKTIERTENELTFQYLADGQWRLACEMGFRLFYDYYTKQRSGGLKLIIHDVKWMPVDTNNLIMLFATVKALCEHFEVEIKDLGFEEARGVFCLPDRRMG